MKRDITAKEFIRKRDAPDAEQVRERAEIRALLPKLGARYGLVGAALDMAMEQALASPTHAMTCLRAIQNSLVPR